MMRRIAALVSALVFLLGALLIVTAAALAWLFVIAAAAKAHWILGLAVFVGSLWLFHRHQAALRAPWELWHALWAWADAEIARRLRP